MKITKLTAALLVAGFAFGAQAATYQPGTYTEKVNGLSLIHI